MNAVAEKIGYKPLWILRKYADDAAFTKESPYEVIEIEGNLLLNEGITALLNLLAGAAEEISIAVQDVHDILLSMLTEIKAKTDNLPADPASQASMNRLLGLALENHVEDDIVRDAAGNKLSSVLYLYDSAANATAHNKSIGLLAKYNVTAAYSGGKMATFRVVKV